MISIIISTYNSPKYLNMVLKSLNNQTNNNFEVVVADDGSGKATKQLILDWQKKSTYLLKHAWQEDDGFRLSASRNNAVRQSSGSYFIFIDGDCIALPNFVENHLKVMEKKYFIRGSRVLLSENYSNKLINSQSIPEIKSNWWKLRFNGSINRILPLLKLPSIRYNKKHQSWGAIGCNIGVSRSDYEKINGFDESYEGWGREDTDFFIRLIRSGILRKEARHDVPVLHLWHPENSRNQLSKNELLLEETSNSNRIKAKKGLI